MKNKFVNSFFALALLVLIGSGCKKQQVGESQSTQNESISDLTTGTFPKPNHIVIVIEENQAYSKIMGSPSAPFINALAQDSDAVLFTNSVAVTHPSQPNYLDLYSGFNQGVVNDDYPSNAPFTTPNLGSQLIAKGKSFATYSQSLPEVGYNGNKRGAYVHKHNPAANWIGTGKHQIPATTNQPFSAFPSDYTKLPTVSFVIPNLNCDMHDGSISRADNWLENNLRKYIKWARTNNSLFILTFDEDDDKHGNHLVTIFCGPMVRSGKDIITIDHYRVLRTIEDMYGLPYAGNAANAKPIINCWK
jgi:hypothetical protein